MTDGIGTVARAMVTIPKTLPADASAGDARDAFADDHVHMLLLTRAGVLRTTLVRDDLDEQVSPGVPAIDLGTLAGRTTRPGDPIAAVKAHMIERAMRRLAVVDDDHRLLGLLCLKRDRGGFCSDQGVADRAAELASTASPRSPTPPRTMTPPGVTGPELGGRFSRLGR